MAWVISALSRRGNATTTRVSAPVSSTRSAADWTVSGTTGVAQSGQYVVPTRAHSSRM
jgi:hypothetical protein